MDDVQILETLAERGEARGAAAVWAAAMTQETRVGRAARPWASSGGDAEPLRELPVVALERPRRRTAVLSAAAVIAAMLAVVGVAASRSGRSPSIGPSATTAPTQPTEAAIDGAFVALVRPHLPAGFVLVSSSRDPDSSDPIALALDANGRVVTVSLQYYNDEQGRNDPANAPARRRPGTVEGGPSGANVATAFGDLVSASCELAGGPCDSIAGPPEVDVRPMASTVAALVTAENRRSLSAGNSLVDDTDRAPAVVTLDRLAERLGDGFELTSDGGPAIQRSWHGVGNPAVGVTAIALPSPATIETTSLIDDIAVAIATHDGWIFVATARGAPASEPPLDAEALRDALLGATQPASSPATSNGAGRLVLDPLPAGWQVEWIGDERIDRGNSIARLYALSSPNPETGPSITLTSQTSRFGLTADTAGATDVTVEGSPGVLVTDGAGRSMLSFGPVSGYWAMIEARDVESDALLAAADAIVADPVGQGLKFPDGSLPPGIVERLVGAPSDPWIQPTIAADAPIPGAHWTDGRRILWYRSFRVDRSMLAAYRLGHADVVDVTINGHAGFVAMGGAFDALGWADGDRIYLVGSGSTDGQGGRLSRGELVDLAQRLRAANAAEWGALQSSADANRPVAPTTTAVSDSGPGR